MNRLPLSDQLTYRFRPPRHNRFYLWMTNRFLDRVARSYVRVEAFDVAGDGAIRDLLDRGDGVLLAPNHSDHADSFSVLELSRRVGRAFHFMAAYQIFQGFRGHLLNRIGAFPVDREGADLAAYRTSVELLGRGTHPLVIFPEGEIHHLCDVVTPLREGVAAIATAAAKRLETSGKTVWIVPVGMKYRFLDHCDPTPALLDLMDELERRAHWFVDRERPIVERLYRYAEGMMGLKEFEYLGQTNPGTL
ncbi:MAG: lysophospholipid acyltransferase family protein, partial [Isosphaeraceae bacterium]